MIRPTRGTSWLLWPGAALIVLLLGLPLVILAAQALADPMPPDAGIVMAVGLSLGTTALSALLTLLLGTPLAYLLARRRFRLRTLVIALVELPIVLPPSVAGLALLLTFGRRGPLGQLLEAAGLALPYSTAAVILTQIFVAAPFYIRAAQVGFAAIPP